MESGARIDDFTVTEELVFGLDIIGFRALLNTRSRLIEYISENCEKIDWNEITADKNSI